MPRTFRELRLDRGLTLAQVADRSGVHKAIVSQIERGRLNATLDEAGRLAAALTVDRLQMIPMLVCFQEQP